MKSKKSTTSPRKIRSIRFPIAPAIISASPMRITIPESLIVQRYHNKKIVKISDIEVKMYIPNGKLIPKANLLRSC